jgi:hypothetical protein
VRHLPAAKDFGARAFLLPGRWERAEPNSEQDPFAQ